MGDTSARENLPHCSRLVRSCLVPIPRPLQSLIVAGLIWGSSLAAACAETPAKIDFAHDVVPIVRTMCRVPYRRHLQRLVLARHAGGDARIRDDRARQT